MEIAGYELEHAEISLPLYVIAMVGMFFMFKYWIKLSPTLASTYWTYFVIIAIAGLPLSFVVVNYIANKE